MDNIDPNERRLDSSHNKRGQSPHFMSATLSSSKQAALKPEKDKEKMGTQPSTQSSIPTSKPRRANWMASAVKRAGFTRLNDGAVKSKKEGLVTEASCSDETVSSCQAGSH